MNESSEKKVKEISHPQFFEISLNRPKKINVLDEELVEDFQKALDSFEESNCEELLITGQGDKGFCAGGDVVSVVKGVQSGRDKDFFFKKEYLLDQRVHSLDKTTGLAHGIVMGGGMGLLMGCSTRILDPSCIIAMPEVTIGFFPDVGATFFLQKIPYHWRVFLTQTGARLNALEAYRIGLCDAVIPYSLKETLIKGSVDLQGETKSSLKGLSKEQEEFEAKDIWLKNACEKYWNNQEGFDSWLKAESKKELPLSWMNKSLDIYLGGSPVSKVIAWELFRWCENRSLVECFKMDLSIARFISEYGDFEEGVRALLVDKDKSPKWKDQSILEARRRIEGPLAQVLKTFS